MTPEYLSHSALNQYLNCSWQYKLERVDKLPTPPAWFFIGGSAVHLATQRMDERQAYPYSEDQLLHIWSEAYDELINEAYLAWPEDGQWRQAGRVSAVWPEGQRYIYWDQRGQAAVKAWHDFVTTLDPVFESIEEELFVPLPSGIVYKGYVDRVESTEGGLLPLDIKTGTKRPSSLLQLGLYRVGLQLKHPHWTMSDDGAWWMAKDSAAYYNDISHITLDRIDRYAQTYVKGVREEIFIPTIGDSCRTCPFTKQCFAHPDYEGDN